MSANRIPTWAELLAAIAVLEAWLAAKVAELKEKYPDQQELWLRIEGLLNAKERTLATLLSIAEELQVLSGGKGPVSHDPVDLA